VEELYGTRYQSGFFSLINVGSGFHCLHNSFFFELTPPTRRWDHPLTPARGRRILKRNRKLYSREELKYDSDERRQNFLPPNTKLLLLVYDDSWVAALKA
jgi:hypothetical protein